MALLRLNGVSRTFGGLDALEAVDLEVREAEILGIIGPNGAGKTTLLNVISGLLAPTAGRISFRDRDITRLSIAARAERGIVRTFQLTAIFEEMTVGENLRLAAYLPHRPRPLRELLPGFRARDRELVAAAAGHAADSAGLATLTAQPASQLSSGHKRSLSLAMALAAKPTVLLLDEPVAGMTSAEIARTLELLRRLRDEGVTVIIVEHNIRVVMGLCDRIAVLNFGRKIADDEPASVRADARVIEAYLGSAADHAA